MVSKYFLLNSIHTIKIFRIKSIKGGFMPGPFIVKRADWHINLAEYIKNLKQRIMYLVVPDINIKQLKEALAVRPTEKFQRVVSEMTANYINKGIQPPESIAPAIYNIADDILSGRQVSIKAGDYIMIQNYLGKQK